jgi:hypothetical protein
LRGNVIEAVADAELIRAGDLVIDLGENVRRVHRIGIIAGGDSRARVADRCKPVVDGVDVFLRHRDKARLIEPLLFDVAEIKRAVAHQRPTHAAAILLLVHRQPGARQRVRRVEALVTEVAVAVAVGLVRPALGHDVDVSAKGPTQLGLPARCDDLKLIDRIDAVGDAAQPGGIVVGGQSVDDEAVGEIALAAN